MNKYRKIFKYILLVTVLVVLCIYSYMSFFNKFFLTEEFQTFENPNVSEFISKNLFFVKKDFETESLFSYNLDTQKTEKILEYEPKNFVQINEKYLGLLVYQELKYSIRLFDLETKEEQIFLEYTHPDSIELVDFYSPTKFAFTVLAIGTNGFEDGVYQFLLYDDGEIKQLAEKDVTHLGGGGGWGFLHQRLIKSTVKFSSDGKKFFYTSPLSYFAPEPSLLDYRVYVFDLANNSYEIIEDASSPSWVNNESVIYSKIVRVTEEYSTYELKKGLYIYDTETQSSQKLNYVHSESLLPKISFSNWKMLYSLLQDQPGIWIYDLSTGVNEQILPYGWDAKWVTPTLFLFHILDERYEPYDLHNSIVEVKLYDIEQGEERELPKDVQEGLKITNP